MNANKPKFSPSDFAIMSYVKREFVLYPVEQNELRTLVAGYLSIHFGLAGICFGAFLSTFITWLTVPLPEANKTKFWICYVAAAVATVYFSVMAIRDYRRSRGILKNIQTETTSVTVKASEGH